MEIENWYSLRFLIRRYLRDRLPSGFAETESDGAGWLAGSGHVVLNRDEIWIRIVRHMLEEFIELAFKGPPEESDWFDVVEVLIATGIQFDATPGIPAIPHRLRDKADALVTHFEAIARALREDRSGFLTRLAEIRKEGIRQGIEIVNGPSAAPNRTLDSRESKVRRSTSYGS